MTISAFKTAAQSFTTYVSQMFAPQTIARTNAMAASVSLAPSVGSAPVNPERIHDSTLTCTPRIVHLAQRHWTKECDGDPVDGKQILRSQMQVAGYLISHPNAIIFDETSTETIDFPFQGSCPEDKAILDKSLPNLATLPSNFKYMLYRHGASHFLYSMGKVNHIHRCISPERFAEISRQIEKELRAGNEIHSAKLRPLIFDQRERELVKEVQQFLSTTQEKNPEIVIIYGANHDFRKYFAGQNFTQIDMT